MLIGWAAGMITGTLMAFSGLILHTSIAIVTTYAFKIGGVSIPVYAALAALIINLVLSVILTPIFRATGLKSGKEVDVTAPADYEVAEVQPA